MVHVQSTGKQGFKRVQKMTSCTQYRIDVSSLVKCARPASVA